MSRLTLRPARADVVRDDGEIRGARCTRGYVREL
jgi:hypothetical protein